MACGTFCCVKVLLTVTEVGRKILLPISPFYSFHLLDYSDVKLVRYLNAELADTFGNLLSRCCSKALNPDQAFPAIDSSAFEKVGQLDVTKKLMESVTELAGIPPITL